MDGKKSTYWFKECLHLDEGLRLDDARITLKIGHLDMLEVDPVFGHRLTPFVAILIHVVEIDELIHHYVIHIVIHVVILAFPLC